MDDLWQQFHRLPKAVRDAVARPEALAAVDSLEQRYPSLDLASFIMRAAVKEFPVSEIPQRLINEFQLDQAAAEAVDSELRQTVFSGLQEYLGPLTKTPPPVEAVIRPVPPRPPSNLPIEPQPPAPPQPVAVKVPPVVSETISTPAQNLASLPKQKTPTPPPPTVQSAVPAPQKPVGAIAPTQEYSEEDAQEIANQARRLETLAAPGTSSLDEIAKSIIAQHNLAFHDELLAKRAVAIIKARLKDIRNAEETMAMLVRVPKIGGLGLDQDIAKNVVASLETQAKTAKERGMIRPPDIIAPPPPPAMPPLQAQQPVAKPPLYRDAASATARPGILPSSAPSPIQPPTPVPPTIKRPADIPPPPSLPTKPAASPVTIAKPAPIVHRARTIDRPAIADITRPMKTMGPAEEMRTMTLMEFRRLGQGANESTARLLEKFRQLQSESFTLWAEALNGWRQSEVYQLYLDMGRQSLEQAIGITEVIKLRAAANQLYLSEHEFTALADFNRQLQS